MLPVEIFYNASMQPYFDQARKEIQEDGISLEGIDWELKGSKLIITITTEQQERFILQLGVKVGKAFMKDSHYKEFKNRTENEI